MADLSAAEWVVNGRELHSEVRSAASWSIYRCRNWSLRGRLVYDQVPRCITELFQGQDTGKGSIEFRVTARAPGQATVDTTFKGIDVPILEGYSRLWTLEGGKWKYDSCQ
ncbi:hypothetical protein CH272_01475 [Rhodococcus sp. 05-340-1]|nr:hypothetical protein CH271_00310 [Rhodococcus sp. 05-340-2]OZD85073.1 hypothetical protein CH272_01475 [Rhodococcus sp. 05-340-1]